MTRVNASNDACQDRYMPLEINNIKSIKKRINEFRKTTIRRIIK